MLQYENWFSHILYVNKYRKQSQGARHILMERINRAPGDIDTNNRSSATQTFKTERFEGHHHSGQLTRQCP